MTFLAPLAGLIGAAIGVPLLVALYLLKLRRKPLKVSSTLLWEQAVQDLQANVPLRWLRWSWLMLLQLAGLICLLTALARPAVPGTAGVGTRAIIVIDRSASMNAADGVGGPPGAERFSRLDQAKTEALLLIEQMQRQGGTGQRPQAMVVAMGAEARVVQGFTSDARDLRDAITAIQPTDQPADLGAVVQIAGAAALAGTDTEHAAMRTALVVFSDGSLEPSRERLPGSVDLRLVQMGPKHEAAPPLPPPTAAEILADNLGIVAMSLRRDAENPGVARVFARVINAGPKETSTTLTCRVDGEAAGLLPLTIPAATIGADGTVTPGEAAGTVELDRPSGGLVVINIPRADLLDADNTAAVVLRAVSKPRILVVGANDAGDPYASARGKLGIDRFLLGVLEDLDPGELRTIDIRAYREEVRAANAAGQRVMGGYDLVIFDRVRPDEVPAVPTISIGAGVPINSLKLEALPPPSAAKSATRFISWKRTHPLLRNTTLDAVLIAPPMRMTIDDSPTGTTDRPTITPLAFGVDGPLIALVQEPGVRGVKRLVLAFDLVRTNWGKDVSFPVFVSSAVDYLTGRGEAAAGRSFTTGEAISVIASPGVKQLGVKGPESFSIDVAPSTDPAGTSASLGIPRLAGVYTLDDGALGYEQIAVNILNTRESTLATESHIRIGGRESRAGTEHAGGEPPKREVWHWFVIAAGILLTIEWFLFAWRSKP